MYLKYFPNIFSKILRHWKRFNIVCPESSCYLLLCGRRGLICDQRHHSGKGTKRAACFFLTVAVPHFLLMTIISAWNRLPEWSNLYIMLLMTKRRAVFTRSSPPHLFWFPLNTVFQKQNFKTYVNTP